MWCPPRTERDLKDVLRGSRDRWIDSLDWSFYPWWNRWSILQLNRNRLSKVRTSSSLHRSKSRRVWWMWAPTFIQWIWLVFYLGFWPNNFNEFLFWHVVQVVIAKYVSAIFQKFHKYMLCFSTDNFNPYFHDIRLYDWLMEVEHYSVSTNSFPEKSKANIPGQ